MPKTLKVSNCVSRARSISTHKYFSTLIIRNAGPNYIVYHTDGMRQGHVESTDTHECLHSK